MSFAVVKYKLDGIQYNGPTRQHCEQVVRVDITALNTDVAYDFSTSAGTFWTSAIADATYGAVATALRTFLLTNLQAKVDKLIGVFLLDEQARLQAAAAAGTSYTVSVASHLPNLTFASGSAPTALTLLMRFSLKDGFQSSHGDHGAAV